MRSIDLTVLVHEGPIARAYLSMLRHRGLRPARILVMIAERRPSTGAPIAPWLPSGIRSWLGARVQDAERNYWARTIAKTHSGLFNAIVDACTDRFDLPAGFHAELLAPADYSRYGDDVQSLLVTGLKDPRLEARLAVDARDILFTGGGIVPESLLKLGGRRFIHVHPGCLPHVRGADGLLWSVLTRGRPGASCFFMAPRIDVGDIILATEFDPLLISIPCDPRRPDDQILYRALFAYLDPVVRAVALDKAIANGWTQIPASRQGDGTTFHFMHPILRQKALQTIFPCASRA